MTDVTQTLIPLGALAAIGLLAYAMIRAGRQQRAAKAALFRDFAHRNGLRYREKDDGTARAFAGGFDGIGRFRSSSLGKVIPTDVVSGTLKGADSILFRHRIRFGEGWEREWFVAGASSDQPLAERCAVQFCRRRTDKSTMYLRDPVLKEQRVGAYDLVVRAATSRHAGKMADGSVLERLGRLGGELPFRPEIQVRGTRVAAYPADRNFTIEDLGTLSDLLAFAMKVAGI